METVAGVLCIVVLVLIVFDRVAPRAADRAHVAVRDRARYVLREFGALMLALLQDLIAIADSHYPDSERRRLK